MKLRDLLNLYARLNNNFEKITLHIYKYENGV